ncbi:hypothetical protein Trydic_g5555 [Trypoxylus dichotomus]
MWKVCAKFMFKLSGFRKPLCTTSSGTICTRGKCVPSLCLNSQYFGKHYARHRQGQFVHVESVCQVYVQTVSISETIMHDIVRDDLHMRKVCAKFMLKLLIDDHKNNLVTIAGDLLEYAQSKPDFLEVITGDEV